MSDQSDPNKTVQNIAEDISDNSSVNWDEALKREPRAAGTLEGLRLIERVAMAHRSARAEDGAATDDLTSNSETPLFAWGSLQVLHKIGEGGFAEVYRAFDTSLQRHVALKLRRVEDSASASSPWIEEARRLAVVRHPNVLVIYGAAIHDEREGIWTDLIEGTTLAEWVEERGPLGAREAAMIVMDVCQALSAVHGSGLVHGDVKASNIMRESGGRLVLMDFGSGHRLDEVASGRQSGTPMISAPELLGGEASTPASDVYALGVLLYWLVSGEYPVEAESIPELRQKLGIGKFVSLRERRNDLPRAFIMIVERALAIDAAERWRGPSELEMALAGLLSESFPTPSATPRPGRVRRWMPAALLVFLVSLLAASWIALNPGEDSSSFERVIVAGSELSVELGMVRVVNDGLRALAPGSPLAPGMQLALQVHSPDPTHVYVLNEDEQGELFVLFPVDGVDLSNPLAGGSRHVLPGRRQGQQQSWVVTSAGGMERFLAVVSRQPLPALEQAIANFRRASADRSVERPRIGDELLESLRGVGGMASAHTVDPGSTDVLEQIAASLVASSSDPDGLWVWDVSFPNPVD